MGTLENSACLNDDSFGPIIQGCRDNFDFTVTFEQWILSIAPSLVFIFFSVLRIACLIRRPMVLDGRLFRFAKVVTIVIYGLLQLAILVLVCIEPDEYQERPIAAAGLCFLDSFFLCCLSTLEHSRSLRPSVLLSTYLFISLIFDSVQARTFWLKTGSSILTRLYTASIGVKVGITLLESRGKMRLMAPGDRERSPEETSGVFSICTFFWLKDLMVLGFSKVLSLDDLYALDEQLQTKTLEKSFWSQSFIERSGSGRLNIYRAILRVIRWRLLFPIIPRLALMGFTFCQPLFLSRLLEYLQTAPEDAATDTGYRLIGACVIIYSGIAISNGAYHYHHQRSLTMIRGCVVSAIFRKTTELSLQAIDNAAAVTLMSTDIERIQTGCRDLHELWANVIEVTLASWLLEGELGIAFVMPICVVVFCIICSLILSKSMGKRQGLWMEKIQTRIGVTADIISNMKSLKMCGLTANATTLVQTLRIDELRSASSFRLFTVFSTIIAFTPLLLSPVFTFAATSQDLDTTRIFTSLSYLLLLSNPLTQLFQSIPQIVAAVTCLNRVRRFLDSEFRIDGRVSSFIQKGNSDQVCSQPSSPHALDPVNHEKKPPHGESVPGNNQHGISVIIKDGNFGWQTEKYALRDLNLIIRSSQLTMVVGPVASGKSTLCKVLLGETPIAHGDVIFRPRLPRIGFCEQIPFLHNASIRKNIISSYDFDNSWYNDVLEATALGDDLATLPGGDLAITGTNGVKLSGGQRQRVAIARAVYARPELVIFDDVFSGLDAATEDHVFRKVFGLQGLLRRCRSTIIFCTHSIKRLPFADYIVALGTDGSVIGEGDIESLRLNNKYIQILGLEMSDGPSTVSEHPTVSNGDILVLEREEPAEAEDSKRQFGDIAVYRHYFSTLDPISLISIMVFGLSFGFLYNFSSIWLEFWARANPSHPSTYRATYAYYLGVYGMLQVLCLLTLGFYIKNNLTTMVVKSGERLHLNALCTLVDAPLSFFSTTDSGITVNRFSQDMSLIDSELPYGLSNTFLTGFTAIGQAAVIATASPYIIIGYPVLIAALYTIQIFYLRTSRQLRLMELEGKSPLYTHFLETLTGLPTIRAFGWVDAQVALSNHYLDTSQRSAYLLCMVQQWLTLTLNLAVTVIAVALVALATQLRTSPGFSGAGLVSLMSFGEMVSSNIRCWTQLENSIGAVSRLKRFDEIVESENLSRETEMPSEEWPQMGNVEIDGVSATYTQRDNMTGSTVIDPENERDILALRNIKLSVKSGEKLAVCGRTGRQVRRYFCLYRCLYYARGARFSSVHLRPSSGKSSLILLLLRLLDPLPSCAQNIVIDNIPLHLIHRDTLRSRLIAVTQETFFFTNSNVKTNLDPDAMASPAECEDILRLLKLWDLTTEPEGVETTLNPKTLSQGQKQLFSLARAILRVRAKSRKIFQNSGGSQRADVEAGGIVLLDEVSSCVDRGTDSLMQRVIREEFRGWTVIAVAHRLETLIDFNKVAVMERGEIIEYGNPKDLMATDTSYFKGLWETANGMNVNSTRAQSGFL